MALFDFLKPKWSAAKMTDEDRARQFWLLQQRTSYTAWKRCRDAYAVFVDLVERQCKEEPVGRLGKQAFAIYKAKVEQWVRNGEFPPAALQNLEDDHITKWDHSTYADVLRGLSLFDQGLARLKQGDRSVFQRTSQGVLEDAANAAHHHYQAYYMGGPRGDRSLVYYGKYVPAIKAALQWSAEEVGLAADGLAPAMADLSAPEVWENTRQIYDPFDKRKKQVIGSSDRWKSETAHLKTLPRVPQPLDEVLVNTGEACPVFGIYEAQVKDGLMVYMCQGQEAFRYGEPVWHPGGGHAISWRLIWEDRRYLDGTIPAEEADYFPDAVSPPDFSRFIGEELHNDWRSDQVVTARTGEPAPYTGRWAVKDDMDGKVFWRKGDALPMSKGHAVEWVYSGV